MKEITVHAELANQIYILRGKKVMLDSDLAKIYGVKPIRLREQVRRNRERFPEDFMFQLNEEEVSVMVSHNAIPSLRHLGGFLPYVFTQEGVAMLFGVLRSARAVQANIAIMHAFVQLREMLASNSRLTAKLLSLEQKYDTQFKSVFDAIQALTVARDSEVKTIKNSSRNRRLCKRCMHKLPAIKDIEEDLGRGG
ncbi:MAG: hypothetical protein A2234_05115 [Elusimicrobia bacterium RIFOXYA2_FULL_58_8]|nr:MAG: hypothetical protein A2285_00035 [Elusimicrobia bacterium RIFOXYA12_FULL_57_11]OGS12004.1 MAG: hypothetical protein A2234_05115 [Elusimicrobia bacterium RIFOXYA2_FULL_58_8]